MNMHAKQETEDGANMILILILVDVELLRTKKNIGTVIKVDVLQFHTQPQIVKQQQIVISLPHIG